MTLISSGGMILPITGGTAAAPSAAIFRGQRAAADAPGPEPDPTNFIDGSITSFLSPSGTELAPLGSGRWICVDANASGGGDGKSWATAFNTIGAAENVATVPGDVIVIKGGTYREAVTMGYSGTEAAPIRVTRYGSDTVRVTGAEVLTGWTDCTDQADALGSPQWASCYKAYIPAGDVIGTTGDATASVNGICLGLMQDQVKLRLAIDGPGYTDGGLSTAEKQNRAFNRKNDDWFYSASGASVAYGTGTVEITNSTALGSRTEAGLTHAWLMCQFSNGNNVRHLKITSFDEGTDTATCKNTYGETSFIGNVAILNAGEDLTLPGFWVFSDSLEGDGTRKVVVYPYDGVDLTTTGTIEYCKRNHAICLTDRAWITVYGIDGDSVYATTGSNGNAFGVGLTGWNGSVKTGWAFEECSAVNISSEASYGSGITMAKSEFGKVQNCTVRESEGQGIFMGGSLNASNTDLLDVTRGLISMNKVSRTFVSGIRPHSVNKLIMEFNEITEIESSHANGASVYGPGLGDSLDVLVFGNKIRTGFGIGFACQDTANIWMICNDVQTPDDGPNLRGIENNGTIVPLYDGARTYGHSLVALNNTCGPRSSSQGDTNGLIWYKTGGANVVNLNNVAHGMGDPRLWSRNRAEFTGAYAGDAPKWLEFSYNVTTSDTALSSAFLTGQSYDAGTAPAYLDQEPAMAGNVKNTTLSEVFVDVDNEDYTPVAEGPLDGTGLPPASSVNSAMLFPDVESWGFPAFDFDRDCDGNPLDWDAPPIGAYVVPT